MIHTVLALALALLLPLQEEPPGATIQRCLDHLRAQSREFGEDVGGRPLGLWAAPVCETLRSQLSLRENEGVRVTIVRPRSLAGLAGLARHDVIVAVEGTPVGSIDTLRSAVGAPLESMRSFEITVMRKARPITIKVPGLLDPFAPFRPEGFLNPWRRFGTP